MTVTRINKQIFTSGVMSTKKKMDLGVVSAISLIKNHPKKIGEEIVFPVNGDFDNKPERILEILKVIDMEIENGYTPLLLHCRKGQDRSPTVAALYLYHKGKFESFDEALEFIRAKNQKIKPKKLFVKFIKEEVLPKLDSEDQSKLGGRAHGERARVLVP
ncbi:MAG: dual specificity protein phosphatase family protein [Thaumarchaeota archaeon]|nr:dual specificity protein phosphatase family protein [Nitrososphaerota archaeon]